MFEGIPAILHKKIFKYFARKSVNDTVQYYNKTQVKGGSMRLIGNVFWFILGGAFMGLGWWIAGVLAYISVSYTHLTLPTTPYV